MPIGDWIRLVPNDCGSLTLTEADSSVLPTPSIRRRSPSEPAPVSDRQSATEYILKLEAEREQNKHRMTALKKRIVDLEDQIISLGGVVSPFIMSGQPSTDKEPG